MRIAAAQVGKVLNDPSPFAGILFYGDDTGRIREHVATATRAVIGVEADPFRSSVLVREDHSRLREEVASLSLGGGRRVVRVQDAADGLAAILGSLTVHRADALILMEGAALTARSKLRALVEKHPHWAAIACYPETGSTLIADIKRAIEAFGLTVDPSALAYLAQELGGDSSRRRGELEKLCLYAQDTEVVTLEIAQACCAVSSDATLGAAVSAALAGQVSRCDALVQELAGNGATGPGVLAVLTNQVQRLLRVRILMDAGKTAEEACSGLQPPVFPRQMPGFRQEVQRWTTFRLEGLGRVIREADLACKRAGSPDFAIAGQLLGAIASRAASNASRVRSDPAAR